MLVFERIKRGISESSQAALPEGKMRFENFVEDAHNWALFLSKLSHVKRIFRLGHSEGSLIVTLVAQKFVQTAGLILVSGTVFSASQILLKQLSASDIKFSKGIINEIKIIIEALDMGKWFRAFPKNCKTNFASACNLI